MFLPMKKMLFLLLHNNRVSSNGGQQLVEETLIALEDLYKGDGDCYSYRK